MRRRRKVGIVLVAVLATAGVAASLATGGRPEAAVRSLDRGGPAADRGRAAPLADPVAGDQRIVAARRRDPGAGGDQRQGWRRRADGQVGGGRRPVGCGDVRLRGPPFDRGEEGRRPVRVWTAECRKAVLSVVEERGNLLVFPANFEGIERSPNAVYIGGSANQVVLPAVRWCVRRPESEAILRGRHEEVWSRCVAEMAKDAVKAAGGEVAGESYRPLAGTDFDPVAGAILKAKPDVVLNMLVGESNVPFYAALRKAGLGPDKLPVMAFGVSEDELRRFPAGEMAGHYAAWSYFQGVDRAENREFVRKFKARHGEDRVTSDAMVAAYDGVRIWAQAAEEAGTADPGPVLEHLDRQTLDGPEGIVTIDPESRVAWRPFHVGRARADGQFDVVWSITKPIHPLTYVGTRSRAQWHDLLDDLKARWGGRWSAK